MKKARFVAVFAPDDKEPSALFLLEGDAKSYQFIRFNDKGKVGEIDLPIKTGFDCLAFREGVAFNRIMRYRSSVVGRQRNVRD